MKLHNLKAAAGSRQENYRKGRGIGSGNGKTAGKGHKGQNSRSGGGTSLGFEGGQLPLFRRLPKRGFKNVNHVNYAIISVSALEKFENGTVITPALLKENGLLNKEYNGLKVLGGGELTKSLTVQAKAFSKSAEAAITKAGGKIEVI
ncbi:MAG: 50S ribosomal protein L15 [Bacilli bacterium]|jgi:large subunit ribosomal protein L15|nr:50S ribosomal protein L15 [Bacilli bacterium]MDD3068582.1 50S ribosomal protein L15 [Bacilli bacterium]MDD3841188.1 50S ribosomal protein L15 [Bacilli bacterium]HKM10164.1 50S ribosomal protein L15 [Bacilli bacterium]